MTRLQSLKAKDQTPDLPPLGTAAHLAQHLFEAGPTSQDGSCLGWQDLHVWQGVTGIDLQPWEARGLRRLSSEYLASAQAAQAADCPPPWTDKPSAEQRDRISSGLRSIFAQLKAH